MATIKLRPTAQTSNATTGAARAEWSGAEEITIDSEAFLRRIAAMATAQMATNLYNGLRPDGSGSMPGRKRDGLPRGMGSRIARALSFVEGPVGTFVIAAHHEQPGHLARILGDDVTLRPPPLESSKAHVDAAFARSVVVKGGR